jgi:SAM-dependent MidA family methyltransferase
MPAPGGPERPADGTAARVARLLGRIRGSADADGFVPFDRFVEIALYAPGDGYYTRADLTRGRSGDYYTAAHVHPLFGTTVARRLLEEFEALGRPEAFRIVEVGAGDGTLARDIATAWPDLTKAPMPEYVRLDPAGDAPGGIAAGPVGALQPIVGVVLANELLDALPFRRIVRRADGWRELGVRWTDGRLVPAEGPPARPIPGAPPSDAAEGTIREIGAAAAAWVRELADALGEGSAILIDYGGTAGEIAARGAVGTLQAIRDHRADVDPLDAPGTSDLSAWVDFSRVRDAARRAGLRETAYRSQSEALGAWGFEAARDAALAAAQGGEARVRVHLAAKSLLFGFGNFRVLELGAGGAAAGAAR